MSDPSSSDDDGIDISADRPRPSAAAGRPADDSSDEEEDDPEEERRIREGFIADDDDDDEPSASGSADSDEGKKKKRRKEKKKKRKRREATPDSADSDALSEDDLDLLAENTGAFTRTKPSSSSSKSKGKKASGKKLVRRRAPVSDGSDGAKSQAEEEEEEEEEELDPTDLRRIFEDRPRREEEDDDDEDDLADFIEEDEREDEDEEEKLERRRLEKERRRKKKAGGKGRKEGDGGISKSTWDDIYDVFGNGDEYDWALEGEDEMFGAAGDGEAPKISDIFEPAEIKARFLTEEDDLVRARDIPERHQLLNSTLSSNPTYIPEPFPEFLSVDRAARWIAPKISERTNTFLAPKKEGSIDAGVDHSERFYEAVRKVLTYLFVDHLEVPFIWEHRRDYIVHYLKDAEGNIVPDGLVRLLERSELWKVWELGLKFRSLLARRAGLDATWDKITDRRRLDNAPVPDGDDNEEERELLPAPSDVFTEYYDEYLAGPEGVAEEGVEGVRDTLDWVGLRYGRELREMQEEEEAQGGERRLKRTNEGALRKAAELREGRAGTALRNIGIPVELAISKNLFQPPSATQSDPTLPPDEWAVSFVDQKHFHSVEAVLKGMRTLQVQEFARNPTLKQIVRQQFKELGMLTIRPTEKGLIKIDDFHPYFSFKYLHNKPISELATSARFLHYLEAEKDLLVSIHLFLRQDLIDRLENGIISAFSSDEEGEVASAWNKFREQNIKIAVRNELIPLGQRWVKEWLRDEVEDFVANGCGAELEKAANQSPFRPKEYEKGMSPSVMAVSHGRGDFKHDAIMCVFIDEQGRVREQVKIDHLRDKQFELDRGIFDPDAGKEHPTDQFKEFVRKRQPACIVVGGFTVTTNDRVYNRVKTIVGELAQEKVAKKEDGGGNGWGESEADREREINDATVPVIYVPDACARLYQNSPRAEKEFPSVPLNAKYCIGLGRYVQSPIHEYCAMRADVTAITVDEKSQKLVPIEKLYTAFERALVNVVNDVGVIINDAVSDEYQKHVLPFVSGLGPRKATKLVKDIIVKTPNQALINRNELLAADLLGPTVCENVIAFLEISNDVDDLELSGVDVDSQPDPLDSTRIHPEDYEFARKMAENALELDEEDVEDDHPSKSVVKLMLDDSPEEKLNELNLDDFADNLRTLRHVEKRYALHVIKDEIAKPGRDRRDDFQIPSHWDVLTMLSGETPDTLHLGFIVAGHVWRVRDQEVSVRLDSGVEAMVAQQYVSDQRVNSCTEVARIGSVQAMIIGVFPERMLVELSMRETELTMGDYEQRRVQPEEPYNWDQANHDKAVKDKKKRTEVNRLRRQIDHPNFFNMNAAQAEQYLATQQRGDCVIRPSSLGIDHLAVTWKVDEGVYQHLDVNEFDKPNPQSVGQILRVANKYTYHDLDELIVSHIKSTVRKIEELMNHEKFKGKTQGELYQFLQNFTMANPGKSVYAFGLNRDRPGYFDLAFLSKPIHDGGVIQTWPVKVNPGSYVLGEAEVGGMLELCNSFKAQYQERLRLAKVTASAGGRTPYGQPGSRTGATPMGRTPAGRTPGGRVDPRTGMTPNPYAAAYQAQVGQTMAAYAAYGQAPSAPVQSYGAAPAYGQPGPSTAGAYGAQSYGWGQQPPSAPPTSSYGAPSAYGATSAPPAMNAPPLQQQQQPVNPMAGINPERAAMLTAANAGGEPSYSAPAPPAPPPAAAGSGTNAGVVDQGWGARGRSAY